MRRPIPEDLNGLLGDDNNAPWDGDTVILQVKAAALPYFGILWQLGGSSARGASSEFPAGLELCDKALFSLRVRHARWKSMTIPEHEEWLVQFAQQLIAELARLACYPILVQPVTPHLWLARGQASGGRAVGKGSGISGSRDARL